MSNPKGNVLLLENKLTPINESSFFINKMKRENYTPFGMEFKRINATQLSNYNRNFSIEIPVIGNILYRAFFEITLPVLLFTDSLITDVNYITYKTMKTQVPFIIAIIIEKKNILYKYMIVSCHK